MRPAQSLDEGQGGVVGLRAGQVASDGAIARVKHVKKAGQAVHHLHTMTPQQFTLSMAEGMASGSAPTCMATFSEDMRVCSVQYQNRGRSGLQCYSS